MARLARVSSTLESIFSKSLQSAVGAQLGGKVELLKAEVALSRHDDADYQVLEAKGSVIMSNIYVSISD